jgi:ABC-type dipeptide/oligopeptide/nickel transport system ATPase component
VSALLEVRDLGVTYANGRQAVKGISFDVAAGETVALVGESGSGKSATAFAIMRLLAPGAAVSAQSHVTFEGRDLLTLDEPGMRSLRGRRLSMVFQEPGAALNPSMRIGDQVAEVAIVHGRASKAEAGDLAVSMLDRTGIRDARKRARLYPHELSGGMQQRVVIAMALLLAPALVIADEPTSALDVTVQDQILALLGDLQRESGTAVLLITHDLGVVAETCSRALVMQEGSIVESASVERLFSAPAHPYTAELLRAAPRLARPA